MPSDPFYKSKTWRGLCAAVKRRAHSRCEVRGCLSRGRVVDHIVSRRAGGSDTLDNLRLLCRDHDNAVKEDATGARRSGGKLVAKGCYPDGSPRDPAHAWFIGDPSKQP